MSAQDRMNLAPRLQAYSVASKSLQTNHSAVGAMNRWPMYAAAAGAALASATSANAGVIYSGIQNLSVSINGVTGQTNLGARFHDATFHLGTAPFKIVAGNYNARSGTHHYRAGGGFLSATDFNSQGFIPANNPFNVRRLAGGEFVDSSRFFRGFYTSLARLGTHAFHSYSNSTSSNYAIRRGQFLDGVNGIAGLSFSQPDGRHFGWVRLRVDDGPNFAETVTAIDWAWEDVAGQGIQVVPEPSTTSLALLAAGSAGVLAWRKRRKQVKG